MRNFFSNKYLLFLLRIILAYIFIYAGVQKIADPDSFAISIFNYRLLPISVLNLLAITLPWIEIIVGILLLFGISVKENSAILFSLLLIFTIAIVISLFRGLSIDCGCFGKGTQLGFIKLGENLLMLVGSLLLTTYGSDLLKLQSD